MRGAERATLAILPKDERTTRVLKMCSIRSRKPLIHSSLTTVILMILYFYLNFTVACVALGEEGREAQRVERKCGKF